MKRKKTAKRASKIKTMKPSQSKSARAKKKREVISFTVTPETKERLKAMPKYTTWIESVVQNALNGGMATKEENSQVVKLTLAINGPITIVSSEEKAEQDPADANSISTLDALKNAAEHIRKNSAAPAHEQLDWGGKSERWDEVVQTPEEARPIAQTSNVTVETESTATVDLMIARNEKGEIEAVAHDEDHARAIEDARKERLSSEHLSHAQGLITKEDLNRDLPPIV